MIRQLHFIFDRTIEYGSNEHFFHFMWGYLLPSVHVINTAYKGESICCVFSSCGPLMDNLIKEVMELLDYNFKIISKTENTDKDSQVIIPRWDIHLLHPLLDNRTRSIDFKADLSSAISQTKMLIEEKIVSPAKGPDLNVYVNSFLILCRSSPPDFYVKTKEESGWLRRVFALLSGNNNDSKKGKAEISGYGTSRRSLSGIEEARQKLLERDIPVETFEPGQFCLLEQIRVFQSCKGIIGIKGAEFANLIWLKPQSQVVLIRPSSMKTPPVQRELSRMLDLNYVEIETDDGFFPKLDYNVLEQHLGQS
jgi:hypothetical protein